MTSRSKIINRNQRDEKYITSERLVPRMIHQILQTVFRYEAPNYNDKADNSRPPQNELQNFLSVSLSVATSVSDKIYVIIFITTMGSSVLILCLSGFMSRDPIFAKDVFKLPRFQYRDYEAISSHVQIGDAIDHNNKRNAVPERLTGCIKKKARS